MVRISIASSADVLHWLFSLAVPSCRLHSLYITSLLSPLSSPPHYFLYCTFLKQPSPLQLYKKSVQDVLKKDQAQDRSSLESLNPVSCFEYPRRPFHIFRPLPPILLLLTSSSSVPSASRRDTTPPSPPVPYRASSNKPHNSHHSPPSAYRPLTPQVLHEHEHSQLALHQDPTYFHTIHAQHSNQLHTGFDSLGVDVPDSVHYSTVQDPVGMTPLERFEVDSTYPYQQYNSYEPVPPQQYTSYYPQQYSNAAHQSEAQPLQHTPTSLQSAPSNTGSRPQGQSIVYYAPQQEYYYVPTTTYGEATSPGNDLAAVGTQFDGYVPTGYAQTF
ncbi:hypothetical protein L207DRAFT_146561 [Hyaloscypha variabilis F]|uniref:Uncharacterized protein n=1 Tax=Hyaloscypha variabilis (strain UAMH 11265 / GT02V1 / F) TaxID=1149755 RepID=A0A2J6R5L9_HYAVF|nr:hypothetical protein L207DRAFT_146561 [Hyaloscypha variabilis F]